MSGSPYGYVDGDPLDASDPTGLICLSLHCLANHAANVATAAAAVAVVSAVVLTLPVSMPVAAAVGLAVLGTAAVATAATATTAAIVWSCADARLNGADMRDCAVNVASAAAGGAGGRALGVAAKAVPEAGLYFSTALDTLTRGLDRAFPGGAGSSCPVVHAPGPLTVPYS
jgi:hypothetical protein